MVDRLGRIGVYGGQAGAGRVPTYVPPSNRPSGIEKLAASYVDDLQKDQQRRDGLKSVQAETEFRTNYLKAQGELDPMSPTYLKDLQAWSDENRSLILEKAGFETPEAKDDLERRMVGFTGNVMVNGIGQQRDAIAQHAMTIRQDAENDALTNIRNDPANAARYIADFGDKAARLNDGIPAAQREKLDRNFADNATLTQAEGMALQGDIEGARKFLAGAHGVSPDSVRSMGRYINQLENEKEQARSKELTTQYADILDRVYSDEFTDPAQLDRPEYAELWKERPTARVELRQRIRNEQERKIKEARAARDAARKAAVGEGAGYSRHDSDLAWGATMLDLPDNDPRAYIKALDTHVRSYTMVPTVVQQQFDRAELSGDPQELAGAAEVENYLHDTFPAAKTGAGPIFAEMRAMRDMYGMDTLQAADAALKRQKTDPAAAERLKEEMPEAFKESGYRPRAALADAVGWSDPATLPPEMVQAYDEVVRDQFKKDGNLTFGKEAAARIVQQRFLPGVTTVGGVERYVPFAPEAQIAQGIPNARAYIPLLGEALTAHFKEQFSGKVHPWSANAGGEWDVEDGQPPLRLVATPETEKAIRAGTSPVRYQLQQRVPGGYIQARTSDGIEVNFDLPGWDELKTYPVIRDKLAEDTAATQARASRRYAPTDFSIPTMNSSGDVTDLEPLSNGGRPSFRDAMRQQFGVK